MSDTQTILSRDAIDAIVMQAAKDEAKQLRVEISSPALTELLETALPVLDELNNSGKVEGARKEIERNTSTLIRFISQDVMKDERTLTAIHVREGLIEFCKKHPDLRPWCPPRSR
jgi:hypothetical protein